MKQELIEVVKQLRINSKRQDAYIDSIPREFQELLLDNTYSNLAGMQCDVLLKALVGDMYEDISWFLYEFTAGKSKGPHCITEDGTEYTYKTDEDYYRYLETQ